GDAGHTPLRFRLGDHHPRFGNLYRADPSARRPALAARLRPARCRIDSRQRRQPAARRKCTPQLGRLAAGGGAGLWLAAAPRAGAAVRVALAARSQPFAAGGATARLSVTERAIATGQRTAGSQRCGARLFASSARRGAFTEWSG